MVSKTNNPSYHEEDIFDSIEEIDRFFNISYDRSRLRNYNIDVISSGNLATPCMYFLAEEAARPNSIINNINWWTRSMIHSNGKQSNDKAKSRQNEDVEQWRSETELREKLQNRFNFYLSERTRYGEERYNRIMNKVNIIGYNSVKDLEKIVRESNNPDSSNIANLTIILNRYDVITPIFNTDEHGKILNKKSREEIIKCLDPNLMTVTDTLFYKEKSDYNACLETLISNQDKILEMDNILNEHRAHNDVDARIEDGLISSLIGNASLAKAFKGYNGTILTMTNPVEIVNQQFASHSNIPANRIFSPEDNDYARLTVLLKEAYNAELRGNEFSGRLKVPPILGGHGNHMFFLRDDTFFGDRTFDETFGPEISDSVYADVLEKLRKFGTEYKRIYGKPAEDTLYNSLIVAIKMMLYEQNSEKMRGSIYSPEHKVFTGLEFTLQRGCIKHIQLNELSELSPQSQQELMDAINPDKELIDKMSKIEGIFGNYKPRLAPIPEVPPEKKTGLDELIIRMQLPSIKVKEISFSAYFRSITNVSSINRIINRYAFNESTNPKITPYHFDINEVDIKHDKRELENTQIHSFGVQKDRLIILAERGHTLKPTDYYINEYNNVSLKSSNKISFNPGTSIKQLLLNDNVYLLMRTTEGQQVYAFDGKIHNLGRTPEKKDFKAIIPNGKSIAGYTHNEIYSFDNGWKLLTKTNDNIDTVICIDSINKILYYLVDNENRKIKTFVAKDLEECSSRTFNAKRYGFQPYSDNNGIQIWTLLDDNIRCFDYDSKRHLFTNDGRDMQIEGIPIKEANIWAVQRDIAALDNTSYVDSTGQIRGDKKYFSLLIKNHKRIYAVPVESMRQYDGRGGVCI